MTPARFTASTPTTDVPLRALLDSDPPSIRHKAALLVIAFHAHEDGTGACVPGDVLASMSGLTPAWARRVLKELIADGWIRQPDPAAPVYDVVLSSADRVPVPTPARYLRSPSPNVAGLP